MKTYALAIAIALFQTNATTAQDKAADHDKSLTEEFTAKSGTLFEKQFHDLGTVSGLTVQLYTVKDLIASTHAAGVRFEMTAVSSYSSSSRLAVIDKDEVAGLLKSLELIQTTVLPSTRQDYTEVNYKSRSGFSAGCYFETAKQEWTTYVQVDKYHDDSFVVLKGDGLQRFIDLLKAAQPLL